PSTTSFGWAAAEPASAQPLTSATRTDGRVLARNGGMIWPSGAAHSITGAREERRRTSGCRGPPVDPIYAWMTTPSTEPPRPRSLRGAPHRADRRHRRDGRHPAPRRILDKHQDARRFLLRVLRQQAAHDRPGIRPTLAPGLARPHRPARDPGVRGRAPPARRR